MSELLQKQFKFSQMVAALLVEAERQGYHVTLGEAYRTPEQAALNAQAGTGIARSLHTKRLAIDLNLFLGKQFLTRSEDYRELGEFWESLGGSWGGRFKKADGNHFSLEHDGVR